MRKLLRVLGDLLTVLGMLSIVMPSPSSLKAGDVPDVSELIGEFLAGPILLIIGLVLSGRWKGTTEFAPFESRATLGILGGIVIMSLGSRLGQRPELLLLSLVALLGGWVLLVWGCTNYMRFKGYSAWFGLFGLLLLLGVIILACFPNRRKRARLASGFVEYQRSREETRRQSVNTRHSDRRTL